jgi:methylglutaconyl-CoA hydratase
MKSLDTLETIVLEKKEAQATITLHRPEVHNAMNLTMIREITRTLESLNREEGIRLIIFDSTGDHFCSGADLRWMRSGLSQSRKQLESESLELAKLFRSIRESEAVTICCVKGRVSGGALGLLAASDFVVAESSVVLAFPEVKLGLVPATIAPHVLRKAGFSRSSDWMMTGRAVPVSEAHEGGLIHRICGEGSLKSSTQELTKELLTGGPGALKGVKALLRQLEDPREADETDAFTSRLIADFRTCPEGQEGMKARLEKRKPRWNEGN